MNTSSLCGALLLAILCRTLLPKTAFAQDVGTGFLTGAADIEELDETEVLRMQELSRNPIALNTAGRARLEESGLFTQFQIASIVDYRKRQGDILSIEELARIDGFNRETAESLRPFVDFSSKSAPGNSSLARRQSAYLTARAVARKDAGSVIDPGAFLKGGWSIGNLLDASAGIRGEPPDKKSSSGGPGFGVSGWSASVAVYGRKWLGKVIAGDFNARFGQGLTFWNGFSLSGLSTCSAFSKRPTGVTSSKTYDSRYCLRGVAAGMNFGNCELTCFGTIGGLAGLNVRRSGRKSVLGITACISKDCTRAGADMLLNVGTVDLWGEAAFDFNTRLASGLAGARWNIAYRKELCLLVRYYPPGLEPAYSGAARTGSKVSSEYGVAGGLVLNAFSSTVDASRNPAKNSWQIKNTSLWTCALSGTGTLRLRASCSYRTGNALRWKADLRADWSRNYGRWDAFARANSVVCKSISFLSYAEGRFTAEKMSVSARITGFIADNWDDRIYVYERDAPGNFSVPSYYGRGISGCLYAVWKTGRSSIYARLSGIAYFNGKPARADIRVQYSLKL
ncbi:MAG: helix-hairpin-helix domain-containing protein [Bacteroidales bacterium]|nr:helix-hairpin-helix domain-containing protein [Bacteroidales bacterium]